VVGRNRVAPAAPFLRQRLPDWIKTPLALSLLPGLVIAGVTLRVGHHAAGWWFLGVAGYVAVVPPLLFVGLRADQLRARKRFVVSAAVSGLLVCVLTVAYGWSPPCWGC
jgi:hypothetical protein